MMTFAPLWRTLRARGVSQYALIKQYGVSPGQLTRLKRDESVSTHTVEQFCRIRRVEDVLEYVPDETSTAGQA